MDSKGTSEPPPEASVRIEVCEKHGLRFNAATEDGCARCRTETGERAMGPRGFVAQRPPDLGRSVLVAMLMIVGIGGSLFAAHRVAYNFGRAMIEEAMAPLEEDLEEGAFDELPPSD